MQTQEQKTRFSSFRASPSYSLQSAGLPILLPTAAERQEEKQSAAAVLSTGLDRWKLINVSAAVEWRMDNSGIYTVINWTAAGSIRIDVLSVAGDMPIISFSGTAVNDLRKAALQWFSDNDIRVSGEHGSYIGYELLRCSIEKGNYVQD
jgi:hypothetical protein